MHNVLSYQKMMKSQNVKNNILGPMAILNKITQVTKVMVKLLRGHGMCCAFQKNFPVAHTYL